MEIAKVISNHQNAIIEIIREYKIESLSGIDDSYILNGHHIFEWFNNTIQKLTFNGQNDDIFGKLFDDLIFCSDEIQFFLANMYLYRPFINNPLKDITIFNGKVLHLNYPNIESSRYSMFGSSVSEKFYNYWDRIGDLINLFFPNQLNKRDVYFSKVIDIIPPEFHDSTNYRWLKNFKDEAYCELNSKRRNLVHYTTEFTNFQHVHHVNPFDEQIIEELYNTRFGLADYYKGHVNQTLVGFEKCLLFLNEVT
ncbi:MAG: Cthe_2314 family HEPN domain-containing protein [Bacteroidetes bacterium]|nr:Cthe_2314 family HEPN domain-containing protein [Bacteroidota bacterium]